MRLTADFSLSRLIDGYIEEMFNEKNVSPENREQLWKFYYDKLSKGVDEGYNPKIEFYDKELANSLKKSISQFSAFKETSFRKDLESLMTDGDRFVPWSEFKKEAFKLSGDYNGRWLEAEYNQTVANANMAQTWKEFEENVDLYPNVKLVTVNDARVRPEHKVLDGVIRPFNDPFWNTHTPPLDWGCRCAIEQTDEEPTDIPGGFQTKIEFENNPAKSGEIFGGTVYETKLRNKERKEANENSINWLEKSTKTKGKVTTDPLHDKNDFKRNKHIADVCAKQLGFDFHIRKHVEIKGTTNPEYLINNFFLGDRKSIKSNNGILTHIDSAKKQMLNKTVNPKQIPYYIVWDLDEVENLDISTITHNISKKITSERGKQIKGLIFQLNGKAVSLSRDEILMRDYSKLDLFR